MRGNLRKLNSELAAPIQYQLCLSEQTIALNDYLDQTISLTFTGNMHCIQCGRKINKSFQQGHCFPCLRRLQECNLCIIHPERCLVESGQCPVDDWAHAHCHQTHIIYLANSSGLKVGITRHTQVPTRWIDQGAVQALPIFSAKNRYQSGIMEVALKAFVNDRTNWRKMLKNEVTPIDLTAARDQLFIEAKSKIDQVITEFNGDIAPLTETAIELDYPVLQYPEKITSLSLDKTPEVSGRLLGIKGQYLLLDSGVINIRKFGGYEVKFNS